MTRSEIDLLREITQTRLNGRPLVREAQTVLTRGGFQPGLIDGLMGPNTRAAIARWNRAQGTPVTPLEFRGAAKRLDAVDYGRAGQRIGVGEDEVRAVLEVETLGGGFDSAGRPKALFEPHIFFRQLGEGSKRERAVRLGLAYPRWGQAPYPRDSYPRIKAAMDIDVDAALRSTSWGLGQVMGFNAGAAGYATAADMVQDFLHDEERHLDAMIQFIITNRLDDELRRHDWPGFARGYNGAGYRTNRYDEKLAAAYAKWQAIPDTPFEITRGDVDWNNYRIAA